MHRDLRSVLEAMMDKIPEDYPERTELQVQVDKLIQSYSYAAPEVVRSLWDRAALLVVKPVIGLKQQPELARWEKEFLAVWSNRTVEQNSEAYDALQRARRFTDQDEGLMVELPTFLARAEKKIYNKERVKAFYATEELLTDLEFDFDAFEENRSFDAWWPMVYLLPRD